MIDYQALLTRVSGRAPLPGLAAAMARILPAYGVTDSVSRLAMFLGQTCEESAGFTAVAENLNYSAETLTRVWPTHFPVAFVDYAHRPQMIANRAYAGRMGNGDEASGDGWRFRGRGLIQLTGRDNYAEAAAATGLDLVDHPELAETPDGAVTTACWFWNLHGLSALADAGDLVTVTRRINGGLNGFIQRKAYVARARAALADPAIASASISVETASAIAGSGRFALAPANPAPPPPAYQPVDIAAPTPLLAPWAGLGADGAVEAGPSQALDDLQLPSRMRSLWTAYGHRALAWSGGVLAAIAAFFHDHPVEAVLIGLLAAAVVVIVIRWTNRREAHHTEQLVDALHTPAPSQPPPAAPVLSDADVARIVAAMRGAA